jgi:signal transduction histidine kinase
MDSRASLREAQLESEVRRLERRLERQRSAREEAEAIGERGMRELYQRQRVLRLLETIATASNEDQPLQDALRFALSQICLFMNWAVGHIHWVDADQDALASSGIWHGMDDGQYEDFRQTTLDIQLSRGRGLPGRVLASGEPLWMPDVQECSSFSRRLSARRCGLHAAFAFPVFIGPQTVAVFEFFSLEVVGPDAEVLRAMAQIGSVLGRAIERKRAEEQLLEKVAEAEAERRAAEAANRAKSDFLAVTSHEVRTPLNAVLGLAQALRRESLTKRQEVLVDGVLDAGAMLLRLLNAVLDLTRIESGKMALDLASFDLRRSVQTVIEIWRAHASECGVELNLDTSGLPEACGILCDQGKIEQTLINLISNALKFSPPGSRVSVRLAASDAGGGERRILLEVCDQGPGVAEADVQRIFQPFEQTAGGREVGGAGLGLSICAGHVALLAGEIGVAAAPGGGARFWLEFRAQASDQALAAPADAVAQVESRSTRTLRILAAEDHPANRMVLKALLDPTGADLVFADNGRAALDAFVEAPFDLVLMDVNMPVMDGVSALQAIRLMGGPAADTPVFMLTANVFDEDVERYRAAGADGVVKKPIDVRELYALVGRVGSGDPARGEAAAIELDHRAA